jgi:uncharacterized membrane protein YgdD (TMEM256/DUF423 family)
MKNKSLYPFVFFNMAMAISFGAIGAHALKKTLSTTKLETFLTGNRYHFYITFSLLIFLILEQVFKDLDLKVSRILAFIGLILFTFGCYIYALSGIKFFVHVVPIGGVAFIFAWLMGMRSFIRLGD